LSQHFDIVGAEEDEVLDAHSAPALEVNARLVAGDLVHLQCVFGELAEAWAFMHLQPYAVPQTMIELFSVARGLYHITGDLVDLDARHTRFRPARHFKVGAEDDVVNLAELVGRLAEGDGTGHVGVVAADHCTHIDDDRLTFLYLATARRGVGHRAIRPRAYDA